MLNISFEKRNYRKGWGRRGNHGFPYYYFHFYAYCTIETCLVATSISMSSVY